MGPSRTLSEINGDFSQKSQIFPTPMSLSPCMKEFPVKLGIGVPDQKKSRMIGLLGQKRSLTLSLGIWIQCTMSLTDRKTNGHRTTAKTALTHSVAQ